MIISSKRFFAGFKRDFDDTLTQAQVDGIEFLLKSFEGEPLWTKDHRYIAYALATIYHETAGSMQPVEEGYYLGSRTRVKNFQKTLRYYPFFGRGYVQLTWNTKRIPNYTKASKALGIDFVKDPDLVMVPENAFKIMTLGMFEGWFTGHKLSDHIHGKVCDYRNARRIINGLDKAGLIAGYARNFEAILRDSASSVVASPEGEGARPPAVSEPGVVSTPNSTAGDNGPSSSEQPPTLQQNADTIVNAADVNSQQQDITKTEKVASSSYQGVGLFGVLKKDFTAVGGGNISFQLLQDYATQASGWPPWVISLIVKLATVAAILGASWLLFRLVHYVVWKISEWRRQHTEATINTDVNRKNVIFT